MYVCLIKEFKLGRVAYMHVCLKGLKPVQVASNAFSVLFSGIHIVK